MNTRSDVKMFNRSEWLLISLFLASLACAASIFIRDKIVGVSSPPVMIYDESKTFLIDTYSTESGTNYLIRGNEPLTAGGDFAYRELSATLKKNLGIELRNYRLLDIPVIDNLPRSTRGDLEKEFLAYGMTKADFDGQFPPSLWPPHDRGAKVQTQYGSEVAGNEGSIIWHPVQGCDNEKNCREIEDRQYNFSAQVEHLWTLLRSSTPTVIYVHCTQGHDRVSALSAAYQLRHLNRTLEEVLTLPPPRGSKGFPHFWAQSYEALVRWYSSTLTR